MASKNGNDSGNSQTPDTVVCVSLTDIKKEQNTAKSDKMADETTRLSKEAARGYKICCLDRAEETYKVYQDLMSCVALGQYKKTEIIQKNIDDYIKKDDEIEKLIAESSSLISDLCTKIVEADSELCTMTSCINNLVFSKSSKVDKDSDEAKKVKQCLQKINNKTNTLKEKAENAVESVVTIGGIQTFTNTASLKDFAANMMTKMTDFKVCIESNIKSTEEEIKLSREELNAVVEKLAEIECSEASKATTIEGLQSVIDFVCDEDCDGDCLDLCADFDNCCGDSDQEPVKKKQGKTKDHD
ncbi:hypothetical protein [Aquimarina sediminis]|uniref:hypothetical protein n=1 Tax=Aquimarina sediminis TaxID=2070536 RepID=UPI000CA05FFD|nr:hypothetical protein [Aquimarina sediminis]